MSTNFVQGSGSVPSGRQNPSDPGEQWPENIAVSKMRVVHPTDKLDAVAAFYRDGLGLTECDASAPRRLATIFWSFAFPIKHSSTDFGAPMAGQGCRPVEPDNPYRRERAITYEDPDGWRVVVRGSAGIR